VSHSKQWLAALGNKTNSKADPMADRDTIAAYDAAIEEYTKLTRKAQPDPALLRFIALIKPGGTVLDLGCGPADASATMRDKGLLVDPVDASAEMVRVANETHDIGARQAVFDDINAVDAYDGVWASFSLLHAARADFGRHVEAVYRALRSGGWFFMGMKLGTGEKRDRLGRQYAYYSKEELVDHLITAGFTIEESETGQALGLAGDVEPWIALTAHS